MGQPAAKRGDRVEGTDTHIVLTPTPTPVTMPFNGIIDSGLARTVSIDHRRAALHGSTAANTPPHVPTGGSFQTPPSNEGAIVVAQRTVLVEGRRIARSGDKATTCNDPADLPHGTVVASGTTVVGP